MVSETFPGPKRVPDVGRTIKYCCEYSHRMKYTKQCCSKLPKKVPFSLMYRKPPPNVQKWLLNLNIFVLINYESWDVFFVVVENYHYFHYVLLLGAAYAFTLEPHHRHRKTKNKCVSLPPVCSFWKSVHDN